MLEVDYVSLKLDPNNAVFCCAVRGQAPGCPAYMSPEATGFYGMVSLGTATDIWSVGCILVRLLTGSHAFADAPEFLLSSRKQADCASHRQHQWVSLFHFIVFAEEVFCAPEVAFISRQHADAAIDCLQH